VSAADDPPDAGDDPVSADGTPASADHEDEWWSGAGADHADQAYGGSRGSPPWASTVASRLGDPIDLSGDGAQEYVPWFAAPEDGAPRFAAEP
jgi:hypothetical protein